MAISVTKKGSEPADRLLSRFNKQSQHTVKGLRRSRYHKRNESSLKQKRGAIIASDYRAERERKRHYN